MRNKLLALFAAGLMGFATVSCDKYTEDLDIAVRTDVMKYTVLLQVQDAKDGLPEDVQISVVGEDADYIYDGGGNKALKMEGGLITLGVHPKHEPTEGDPIKFTVKLSGTGFLDSSFPVTITKDQFNQIKTAKVVKLSNAPTTVVVETKSVALAADGTSPSPIVLNTNATAASPTQTEVVVPANTQFQDVNGTPIAGGSVNLQVINFNSENNAASVALFPGGSLLANDVTTADGTKSSAILLPAGLAQINMSVNGKEVRKFSQPISLSIGLNADFKKPNSANPIAAGDKLDIYSYTESTGKWAYEKEATVTMVNGKPTVSFTTNHLTVYGAFLKVDAVICFNPSIYFVNAPHLKGITETFKLEVRLAGSNEFIYDYQRSLTDGQTMIEHTAYRGAPANLLVYNNRGQLVATSQLNQTCGTDVVINIAAPAIPVQAVTLNLEVRCPSKGLVVIPDFDMVYRPAASTGAYTYLGKVVKGQLVTTALEVGKSYDFLATLGGKTKRIDDHLISSANMSTTAGEGANMGSKAPAQNAALLVEFCGNSAVVSK
ncbi:hypothetical protein ACXYMU_00805 [Pontibacter sp. CAU 1760]